jgi:hypothetical protein
MAQDEVKRNVAELATRPKGRDGRQSKSLTLAQASAILDAVAETKMRAYGVVSLLTGPRTEELRAPHWTDIDLVGLPDDQPPVPPTMAVWRSVRATGDTKTRLSRRTLALPARCVEVLTAHREAQDRMQADAAAMAGSLAGNPAQGRWCGSRSDVRRRSTPETRSSGRPACPLSAPVPRWEGGTACTLSQRGAASVAAGASSSTRADDVKPSRAGQPEIGVRS